MEFKNKTISLIITATMLTLIFLLFAWKMSQFYNIKLDDAFIYHRISYNLLNFHTFSYNSNGIGATSTSLLHPLINAFFYNIFGHEFFPIAVNFITGIYILLQVFILFLFYNKENKGYGWFFLSILLVGTNVYYIILGMETTMQMLFVIFYAYLLAIDNFKHKYYLLGILAAFSFFIRPDLAMIIIVGYIVIILQEHNLISKNIVKMGLSFIFSFLGVLLINNFITGSFLPTTLATKIIQGKTSMIGTYFNFFIQNPLSSFTDVISLGYILVLFGIMGLIPLIIKANTNKDKEATLILTIVIYGFLHALIYSIIGITGYKWYFIPFTVGIMFSIYYLAKYVLEKVFTHKYFKFKNRNHLNFITLSGIILSLLILSNIFAPPHNLAWNGPLGDSYQSAGSYINNLNTSEPVYASEVGIVGYYAINTNIRDYWGVTYPQTLKYDINNRQNNFYVMLLTEKPQYIFINKEPSAYIYFVNNDSDNYLNQNYKSIKEYNATYLNWHFVLYKRNT